MKAFLGWSATLCIIATLAVAHSEKQSSVPADGATLTEAPEIVQMTFDGPIRLTLVRLLDEDGAEIALDPPAGPEPTTTFRAEPDPLVAGRYRVEWRGLAADGHVMRGSFSFIVED